MIETERPTQVHKIECEDGRRYIVYNAAVIGNPADHVPDKWYVRPYPVPLPLREEVGEPFDSAEEAKLAARARHARVVGASGFA
jgi:hypothetical protein